MKTNTIKSQKGFSLVELMVVVAILGILATMAVPQVTKFMAKARQSEAKSNLAAIYTANKAFFTEYNGYHSVFQIIGYAPEGQVRYNTGFAAAAADPSGYTSPAGATDFSTSTYCKAPGTAGAKCVILREGATETISGTAIVNGTNTEFIAEARADLLNKGAAKDVWTIDQNKMVQQTENGID